MARGSGAPAASVARGRRRVRWLGLLGLLALIAGAVSIYGLPRAAQARPMSVGVSDTAMQAAVNAAGWPQQNSNWCGVATIAAVAAFRGGTGSQSAIASYLNSSAAISPWGDPSPPGAFAADIARDSGTDPRALAVGLSNFAGGAYRQFVDGSSWDATGWLAADLEFSHQPISVIVDGGQHSVVVSQIFANGDPAWNPNAITGIEVWDPGYNVFDAWIQPGQKQTISLWQWLNLDVYWGQVYSSVLDPDPAVGPYTYDPAIGNYNHLWVGNFVYIRPGGVANAGVDWAITPGWAGLQVIPGQHGELPPGYHFPPTPTPIPTATPTPAPTRQARAAPTLLPTLAPTVAPTAPPTATATPTAPFALTAQSLCVEATCFSLDPTTWGIVAGAAGALALGLGAAVTLGRRRRQRV